MRTVSRSLRWLLWVGLCLALISPAAARADVTDALAWTLAPERPLVSGRAPIVALDAAGQAHVLWQEQLPETDLSRLLWVTAPRGRPHLLSDELPRQRPAGLSAQHPGYTLRVDGQPTAAWALQTEEGRSVIAVSLDGSDMIEWQVPPETARWTFGLDPAGGIVGAWFGSEALHIHRTSQDVTITLPVDPAWIADRLHVGVNARDQGFAAWSGRLDQGQSGGVWYATLATGATPVQVMSNGLLADAAIGPDGVLHMAWFTPEGLYYANNLARDSRRLVEPGLLSDAPVALAANGEATAHLAWLRGGDLWYGTSANWEISRQQLVEQDARHGLSLAVDAWHTPRILWSTEDPESGVSLLQILRPHAPAPALQVTWPLEGAVLTSDTIARVAANRPSADWQRIEFYLQEDGPGDGQFGLLHELGIVREGVEGWQVPLPTAELDPTRQYRVVALGVDQSQQVTRAVGGWFRAHPSGLLWLWPQPFVSPVSGQVTLALSVPPDVERFTRLDLYLTSAHTHVLRNLDWGTGAEAPADHYISLTVQGTQDRPWVQFDSRTLPDGTFHLMARGHTAEGQTVRGYAAQPLVIDNTLAPTLTGITARLLDAATGALEITALAEDPHRGAEHVGLYLQREETSSFAGAEPSLPDMVWAGEARRTEQRWQAILTPEPHWYDQRWIIWAVACDERDICAATRSERAQTLWDTDRPALFLVQPSGATPLRGTETIRLAIGPDAEQLSAASAWLEQPDGGLMPLGDLIREGRSWLLAWDTTAHRDGPYRLLVWARTANGDELPVWSTRLTLANVQPAWRFDAPATAQRVKGMVEVALSPLAGGEVPERIAVYHRDAHGALALIGQARPHEGQWRLLWNTHGALDGNHVLVAALETELGTAHYLEHPVEVVNGRPSLSMLRGPGPEPVRGLERTVWYAQHPAGAPLLITVEYSPDAGGHWLPLARDLSGTISLTWDSELVPDSDAAYLRVTASDGMYQRQVLHGPFTVANQDVPLDVTVARPHLGDTLGRTATVAWQTAGAHPDEIEVTLYYRQGDGHWQRIASGLPGVGQFAWDTSILEPGPGYAVRAMARSAAGVASADDIVAGLTLVDNDPPSVELVWPNDRVRLSTEAVILWRSDDPDGDPLTVDLYYSDNGGLTWFPLAEDLPDSGYYVWQVAFLPRGDAYRLKVVVSDGHAEAQDQSRGLIALGPALPPQVDLLSPQDGGTLSGMWPIRWWTVGGISEDVEIDIMIRVAGWGEWRPLAENLRATDTHVWDTRRYSNGTYDLIVRARLGDQRSISNVVSTVQVHNASVRPLQVELLSPLGGEMWTGLREVRWRVHGAEGHSLDAALEVSPDAGATWYPLAEVDADQGRYLWLTDDWPLAGRYLLRITATDGERTATAISPGAFGLVGTGGFPPQLTITSPTAGGELLGDGRITWIAEDADADPLLIDILLSADEGESWQPIASRLLNTGEYILDHPLDSEGTYRVALIASDGLHRVGVRSPAFAPIIAEGLRPTVSINAPATDAVISDTVAILWEAADPAERRLLIDIAYSGDGAQTWHSIAEGLANSGGHDWDTRALPNGAYLLRLVADNGLLQRTVISDPLIVDNPGGTSPYLSWAGEGMARMQTGAYEILWRAHAPEGNRLSLSLEFSLGPHGPWMPLANGLANTGRYVWDGAAVPNVSDLWLRMMATDGRFETSVVSEAPLAIRHPGNPSAEFVTPSGGEIWTGKQLVRWRVTHNSGPLEVAIQRSLDGGVTWSTLESNLPAVGSYLWDTAQTIDGSAVLLRILATKDTSQGAATLQAPILLRGNEPRDLLLPPFR
jgi:hypothetical protein